MRTVGLGPYPLSTAEDLLVDLWCSWRTAGMVSLLQGAFIVGFGIFTVSSGASAADASCDTLTSSMTAVRSMPHHSTTHMSTASGRTTDIEAIILKDTAYLKLGDEWTQMDAGAASRQHMGGFKDFTNCRVVGSETVNGTPTQIIHFTRRVGEKSGEGRAWIGDHDNRPYKLEGQVGDGALTTVFQYDNIKAP